MRPETFSPALAIAPGDTAMAASVDEARRPGGPHRTHQSVVIHRPLRGTRMLKPSSGRQTSKRNTH